MGQQEHDFFDVVTVGGQAAPNGARGVVLGVTRDDESGDVWYAVRIDGQEDVVMVAEIDLGATGEKVTRETLYDGSSVRVNMQGEVLEYRPGDVAGCDGSDHAEPPTG